MYAYITVCVITLHCFNCRQRNDDLSIRVHIRYPLFWMTGPENITKYTTTILLIDTNLRSVTKSLNHNSFRGTYQQSRYWYALRYLNWQNSSACLSWFQYYHICVFPILGSTEHHRWKTNHLMVASETIDCCHFSSNQSIDYYWLNHHVIMLTT